MDNSAFIHLPAALACRDPRLFWLLALELYKAELLTECDHLLDLDWSELTLGEDAEDIASQLALAAFAKDDLPRLQMISEGFVPDAHQLYFQRLREVGKRLPQSKKCIGWMQSQSLLGKGLDGFKSALREGSADLARTLHQPTAAEAESAFYELAGALTKETLSLLLFLCPDLVGFNALTHASKERASEEALCFLAWKIEESRDKAMLRNPNGDDQLLGTLLLAALTRRQFTLAKKLFEWNHSIAFDKLEPRELAAPWDDDPSPIKLDGSRVLALTPSDFAGLYAHEGFARALAQVQAPAPNAQKIAALLTALGAKLETRRPGQGAAWAAEHARRTEALAKSVWRA